MLTTTQIKSIKTGILSDVGPYRGLRLNATSAGKSWIFRYKNFEGKIKQLKLGRLSVRSERHLSMALLSKDNGTSKSC